MNQVLAEWATPLHSWFALVTLALLGAACSTLPAATASVTECNPEPITISNVQNGPTGETWTASCGQRVLRLRAGGARRGDERLERQAPRISARPGEDERRYVLHPARLRLSFARTRKRRTPTMSCPGRRRGRQTPIASARPSYIAETFTATGVATFITTLAPPPASSPKARRGGSSGGVQGSVRATRPEG